MSPTSVRSTNLSALSEFFSLPPLPHDLRSRKSTGVLLSLLYSTLGNVVEQDQWQLRGLLLDIASQD